MWSYQELKNELKNLEEVSQIDFLLAESICSIFNLTDHQAKIWLTLMSLEKRLGNIFFDPLEVESKDEIKEFLKKFPLSPFNEVLRAIIQREMSQISLPLIQVRNKFCFSKTYDEAFSWIEELKEILNHSSEFISHYDEKNASLSYEQQQAICSFFSHHWMILVGGPGRGKTFTAKKIVEAFLIRNPNIRIVTTAPTGKAAENLARAISSIDSSLKLEPKTIHSLLGISPTRLIVDADDKLDVDLIIVDECSMMDLTLFSLLVKKIKLSTKVLLIGDPNQLPPVQGISPFRLLLEVHGNFKNFSVEKLTIPFRTDCKSLLELNDGILERDFNKISKAISSDEVNIFPIEQLFTHLNSKIGMAVENLKKDHIDFSKLYMNKVLTTHNVGPYGAEEINSYCLKFLYTCKNKSQLLVPVIFVENDEKVGIYNGKLAFYSIFDDHPKIYIDNFSSHSPHLLPKFQLAFAISIHKSQGSEFDHVFLSIQEINEISNELIYTAVSRAKKRIDVFGKLENLITKEAPKYCEDEFYKNLCVCKIEESTLKTN